MLYLRKRVGCVTNYDNVEFKKESTLSEVVKKKTRKWKATFSG